MICNNPIYELNKQTLLTAFLLMPFVFSSIEPSITKSDRPLDKESYKISTIRYEKPCNFTITSIFTNIMNDVKQLRDYYLILSN